MATKQELLEGISARDLPARRVEPVGAPDNPLETVEPGMLVAVYSRGSWRLAQVITATDKRAAVAYTTEGAWKDARKIQEMYANPSYVDTRVKQAKNSANNNFDNYYAPIAAGTYRYQDSTREETLAEARRIVGIGREAYAEEEGEKARARETAARDASIAEGDAAHVTVTTKYVKRDEIFDVKEAS
jgi:hypothetical protein